MSDATSARGASVDGGSQAHQSLRPANDATDDTTEQGHNQAGSTPFGVTVEAVKSVMHTAGYRVEIHAVDGGAVLRSATGGLAFEVRLGNRLPPSPARHLDVYLDVAFLAALAVQGSFPQALLNEWNKNHRFGRVYLDRVAGQPELLVLRMDVLPLAGPAALTLRAYVDIWDALVQQFIAWLTRELRQLADPSVEAKAAKPAEDQGASVV